MTSQGMKVGIRCIWYIIPLVLGVIAEFIRLRSRHCLHDILRPTMAAVFVILLIVFFVLIFSGDSSSGTTTTTTTTAQTNYTMAQNTTATTATQQPISHCIEAALFLSWLNPSIAIGLVPIIFILFGTLVCLVGDFFAKPLQELVRSADSRIRRDKEEPEAAAAAVADSSSNCRRSSMRSGRGRGGEAVNDDAFSDAADDAGSDAETMVEGSPSRGRLAKEEAERLLETDPASEEPVVEEPKPRSAISAMTSEEIRSLSHIFMQNSLFTFALQPLVVFLLCLMVNNANFCTIYYARYPEDLLYMLWVIVPGYLTWSGFVVLVWGGALAVILGREKERDEGAVVTRVQALLAFVVQPVLMLLSVFGTFLYYQGVERLYQYGVGVMERRISRHQQQHRPPGEGGTMLLPVNRDG